MADPDPSIPRPVAVWRQRRRPVRRRRQSTAWRRGFDPAILLQHVGDAVVAIDREYRIQFWNRAAEALYGWAAAEVIGQDIDDRMATLRYIDGGSREDSVATLEQRGFWRGDVIQAHRSGRELEIEALVQRLYDAGGNMIGMVAINRDIGERRNLERQRDQLYEQTLEAEEAITALYAAESVARYEAEVLQAAHLALTLTFDVPTILATLLEYVQRLVPAERLCIWLLEADLQLVAQISRPAGSAADPPRRSLLPPSAHPALGRLCAAPGAILLQGAELATLQPSGILLGPAGAWLGGALAAGTTIIGLCTLEHALPGGLTALHRQSLERLMGQVALILQNAQLFTEVHAGRERLQTLSRQLVALQEAERAHLARELHDEIGQMLTGLNVQLEVGTRIPPSMLAERMALAQGLVRDLTSQVRELSLSLRPAMLDDLGLLVTLEWFVQRYTAQTMIAVQFTHHGLGQRFAPAVEITTYRIIQEALTNAARHAGVQTVSVSVSANSSRLSLMIEDQGRGFDREQIRRSPTSHGLIGLRERALLLGGFVTIASSPGLGTRLSAELPLSQPHERGIPWR